MIEIVRRENPVALMKLQETEQGIVIEVLVKPRSKQFQAKIEDGRMVVFCREAPTKGRVNRELTR
ncbi:MAG: hypothetical protein JSW53_01785, partial [Candidatus Bathyarchaeota archaeon]